RGGRCTFQRVKTARRIADAGLSLGALIPVAAIITRIVVLFGQFESTLSLVVMADPRDTCAIAFWRIADSVAWATGQRLTLRCRSRKGTGCRRDGSSSAYRRGRG